MRQCAFHVEGSGPEDAVGRRNRVQVRPDPFVADQGDGRLRPLAGRAPPDGSTFVDGGGPVPALTSRRTSSADSARTRSPASLWRSWAIELSDKYRGSETCPLSWVSTTWRLTVPPFAGSPRDLAMEMSRECPTTRPCAGAILERRAARPLRRRPAWWRRLGTGHQYADDPVELLADQGRRTRSRAHTRCLCFTNRAHSSWFGSHEPVPANRALIFLSSDAIQSAPSLSNRRHTDLTLERFREYGPSGLDCDTATIPGRITRSTVTSTVTLDRDGMPR